MAVPYFVASVFLRSVALNVVHESEPQVTLPEHTPAGSTVVTVTATDRDSGENGKITYSVMSSTQEGFYIDPNNGLQHSFSLSRVIPPLFRWDARRV